MGSQKRFNDLAYFGKINRQQRSDTTDDSPHWQQINLIAFGGASAIIRTLNYVIAMAPSLLFGLVLQMGDGR
jgi:hypothetical protein